MMTTPPTNIKRRACDSVHRNHATFIRFAPVGASNASYSSATPHCGRRFWSICVAWLVLCAGGCDWETNESPGERLRAADAAKDRQERVCEELRSNGAECESDFVGSFPFCRITLGDHWKCDDQGTDLFRQLNWIDELTLASQPIDMRLLAVLVSGPRLTVLRLHDVTVPTEGMMELEKLTALRGLELRHVSIADDDWKRVFQLPLLWLSIDSCANAFAGAIPEPGQLPRLFSLQLGGPEVSDAVVMRATRLEAIRALSVQRTGVTDSGIVHLRNLPHLAHLDLSFTAITGRTLGELRNQTQLREIILDRTASGAEAIKQVSSLPAVESLSLNDTPITDSESGDLARMPQLRTVSLIGTRTTDETLRFLAGNHALLTAIDVGGDVVVFQRRWLEDGAGKWLPRWAASQKKRVFLWTAAGRTPLNSDLPN